jgi:hypothetical protein
LLPSLLSSQYLPPGISSRSLPFLVVRNLFVLLHINFFALDLSSDSSSIA